MYIYILKLTNNKWYIGITSDMRKRLYRHIRGYGSKWTGKYRMIRVYGVFKTTKPNLDEKIYTLNFMKKYGVDNVRGYKWCRRYLINDDYIEIKNEIDKLFYTDNI